MIALRTLQGFALFAELDEDEVKSLATIAREISFQQGDCFCREGDPAENALPDLGWLGGYFRQD